MTNAERAMCRILREGYHEHHFRKQVPLRHFIFDFACHRSKLVIEVDGGQHRGSTDDACTTVIRGEGYQVLRFWNHEVLGNPDGVWTAIDAALRGRSESPLPLMGRGGGGVSADVERSSEVTPTQPSPIKGEG